MSTAKQIKPQVEESINNMLKVNQQAFSNVIWDSPEKAIAIYQFWAERYQEGQGPNDFLIKHNMEQIEAYLMKAADHNCNFLGVNVQQYLEMKANNQPPEAAIEDILPKMITPEISEGEDNAIIDAETEIKPADDDKQTKVINLFAGVDLGEMPAHQKLNEVGRKLLSEGREEDCLRMAMTYFGKGNYTPKGEGQKPVVWKEKACKSWVAALADNVRKANATKTQTNSSEQTTEVTKEATEEAKADLKPQIEANISNMQRTLELEEKAFQMIGTQYLSMLARGTEDREAAEELINLFFKNRPYNHEQVNRWKTGITALDKVEDVSHFDHFAALGVSGNKENNYELKELGNTYEGVVQDVLEFMQSVELTAKSEKAAKNQIASLTKKHFAHILPFTTFKNANEVRYNLYTTLHYNDFIHKVMDVNFTVVMGDSNFGTRLAQDQEETTDSSTSEKENASTTEDKTATEVKAPKPTKEQIKEMVTTLIKNGGIIDDLRLNDRHEPFVSEDGVFKTEAEFYAYVEENFNAWRDEWRMTLKTYPMYAFEHALDGAIENDMDPDEFIKESKEYLVKPDGKYLQLVEKAENGRRDVMIFTDDNNFEGYVKGRFARAASEKAVKAETSDVEKSDTEVKTEIKVEEQPKVTVEPTAATVGEHKVKEADIESHFNRGIKKGTSMKNVIQRHKKLQLLIRDGGSIISTVPGSGKVYDTSAESLEDLMSDLQMIWDRLVEKRRGKKTLVDKVKDHIAPTTDKAETKASETPEEKEEPTEIDQTDVLTDPDGIHSINDMRPAGLKLIEDGCTPEELLDWGAAVLLDRQMQEQQENAIFHKREKVDKFVRGLYSEFFKKANANQETKVNLECLLKEYYIQDKAITYPQICKKAHELNEKHKLNHSSSELLKMVREWFSEAHNAWKKDKEQKIEEQKKVFTPEKVSSYSKTVWDIAKNFAALAAVYGYAKELIAGGSWKDALNMAIETIESGKIEDAKGWSQEQIIQWFNSNFSEREETTSTKEEAKAEPDAKQELPPEFKAIRDAVNSGKYNVAIKEVLTKLGSSKEVRNLIVTATKQGTSKFTRKLSKATNEQLHEHINKVIEIIGGK